MPALVLLAMAFAGAQAQSIANGSFEVPALAPGANASSSAPEWLFIPVAGSAGVVENGGRYMVGSVDTTDGVRALYLQGAAQAKQSILASTPALCTASYKAQQRSSDEGAAGLEVRLEIDGVTAWAATPVKWAWTAYTTTRFALGQGWHELALESAGNPGTDNTVFIDALALSCMPLAARSIANGDFEFPDLADAYSLGPIENSYWIFSDAGIAGVGSAFAANNPIAPNGKQVAFISRTGYMAQTISIAPGTYTLSFKAAQRATGNAGAQYLRVLVDDVVVGGYRPPGVDYLTYRTSPFQLAGGIHVVRMEGQGNGGVDFTALIDDVQVEPVTDFWGFTDQGFTTAKWRTNYDFEDFGTSSRSVVYATPCLFADSYCLSPTNAPTAFRDANAFALNLASFDENRFWVLILENEPGLGEPFEHACNTGPPDSSQPRSAPGAGLFAAAPVRNWQGGEQFYRAHLLFNFEAFPNPCGPRAIPYMSIGAHTNRGNKSASAVAYNLAALNPAAGIPHSVAFTAKLTDYKVPQHPDTSRESGLVDGAAIARFVAVAAWPDENRRSVPRMIQVNLLHNDEFHDSGRDKSGRWYFSTMNWNWPIVADTFYEGAEVAYIDAEEVQPFCGFPVQRMLPTDVDKEAHYDIDLHALYRCASSLRAFSNPMPDTQNIPVTVIDWAIEGYASIGYLGVAISNMVMH